MLEKKKIKKNKEQEEEEEKEDRIAIDSTEWKYNFLDI